MKPRKLNHIGIVVRDAERAARAYQENLGLEVAGIETLERYQVRIAYIRVGDTMIELVQPLRSEGRLAEALRAKGEGLDHICFEVEDIEACLAELKAKGVPLLDQAPRPGGHNSLIAFLHPEAGFGGALLELCQPAREH